MTRRPEPIRGLQDERRIRWLGENDTEEELAKGTGERGRFFKALDAFQSDEPGGGDFAFALMANRLALTRSVLPPMGPQQPRPTQRSGDKLTLAKRMQTPLQASASRKP